MMRLALLLAFLLILFCSEAPAQQVYTHNIVIVLDASGSMDSDWRDSKGNKVKKMDSAKMAMREVLKQLPADTNIGLVVFSASNVPNGWLYQLGPRDDSKLLAAINLPNPGGGTPLGDYVKMGADRLLAEREKQHNYGSYRLLVITDGAENQGKWKVDRVAPEVMARGIELDTIGVAMESGHTLATKSNSYRSANDPAALLQAVKDVVLAEVQTSDTAGKDAFSELAGIPNEVAVAMIKALSEPANQPIGEKPKPRVNSDGSVSGGNNPQPQETKSSAGWWILGLIVVIVIIIIIIAASRSSSRGYRY